MRMTVSKQERFPLVASLLEVFGDYLDENPEFKATLFESCGGEEDDLERAIQLGRNPWVTITELDGGDPRGRFSMERSETLIIDSRLAERFEAGGDLNAYRDLVTALARGLLHWLMDADWLDADDAPGAAFETLVAERAVVLRPPRGHEPVPDTPPEPGPVPSEPPEAIRYQLGAAILDIAKRHLGQDYRFTPTPDYNDPDWKGPFDCAEYASYCAFRAYKIAYGVVNDPANRFNSYSGYWRRDAEKRGIKVSVNDALHIPGAVLLRYPPPGNPPPFGHVAISLGNGGDTYEARGKNFGVVKHTARNRSWDTAVLIPGVLYDVPGNRSFDLLIFKEMEPPPGYSPIVEKVEERLVELGFMAESQVDGFYDAVTARAVSAFQDEQGIAVDGEVGPETGTLLGLGDIWKKAPDATRPGFDLPLPDDDGHFDTELLTLARTIYGEARGEPRQGMEAVANVILNRVKSNRYPNTVSKVCLQRMQFSCWNDGDPNKTKISRLVAGDNATFDLILAIAKAALMGGLPNLIGSALHYHARSISPRWVRKSPAATLIRTIGNHLFWTGIR